VQVLSTVLYHARGKIHVLRIACNFARLLFIYVRGYSPSFRSIRFSVVAIGNSNDFDKKCQNSYVPYEVHHIKDLEKFYEEKKCAPRYFTILVLHWVTGTTGHGLELCNGAEFFLLHSAS